MAVWLQFFKERLPLPILLIMSVGFTGTSQALGTGHSPGPPMIIGVGLNLLFFVVMRVMDEVKDFTKDQVAYPERPLPRGLITLEQARNLVRLGLFALLGGGTLLAATGHAFASLLFFGTVAYLFLMYKEFYAPEWLDKHLIVYLISHQSVLVLLSASSVAMSSSESPDCLSLLRPGLFLLATFFVYEVARKLNPQSHPILRTYRVHYGIRKTGYLLVSGNLLMLLGIAANATSLGHAAPLLGIAPVLISILYIPWAASKFKSLEGLAGLMLLVNLWVPFLIVIL